MVAKLRCSTPETRCPDCGGRLRRTDEVVCESCGLVIESDPIDHGPEWRFTAEDDTKTPRCGEPNSPRFHDRGLSTKIGNSHDRRHLSAAKRRQVRRQRRLHNRARAPDRTDRSERDLLGEIKRVAAAVDLSDSPVDRACAIGTEATTEAILQGRNIDALAAAAVHIAARQAGIYRRVDTLADVAHCSASALRSASTTLQLELRLKLPVLQPTDVLPRTIDQLPGSVPETFEPACLALAREIEQSATVRGSPTGIAGGVVRVVDDSKHWTQQEIAEAANIVPATVRANARKIRGRIDDTDDSGCTLSGPPSSPA